MTEPVSTPIETRRRRPVLLTLLCVLSIIGNSIVVLIGLGGIFLSGYIADLMDEYSKGYESLDRQMMLIFSYTLMLIFGLKLWGVVLMFLGRKGGYILYLIPTALLMIANVALIVITYNFFATGYLLISILLVVTYGLYLKHMR